MKANNGKGNNSERDIWQTPSDLFEKLNQRYLFSFDCCASLDNTKCRLWTDYFEDIEKRELNELMCWMNPPFSKATEMFKHFFKVVKTGVAIYRCDNMETKVWQDVILPNCDWVFIPEKRICYVGLEGQGSRFPSALIGIGVPKPINIKGICLKRTDP